HMMFNFQVNQATFYALAAHDARPLVKAIERTKPRPLSCQWGIFLRNHDELDLGRLTETQRQAVFAEFGPEKGMQLYNR
ncbi:trehalose synthase, partial [Pseudomonas sp. GP01-A4]